MIRIKCPGPTVHQTEITNAETGKRIEGVCRLDIVLDGSSMGPATAKMVFYPKDIDIVAELREVMLKVVWAVWRFSDGHRRLIGIFETEAAALDKCIGMEDFVEAIELNELIK